MFYIKLRLDTEVHFPYAGTTCQRADGMTKGMTHDLHEKAVACWGMTTTR